MGETLAGTDKSDMPRHLVQSDFEPFPFQSGRIMAKFQSVGMTLYFQMSVKRGSSQLMMGAPPELFRYGISGTLFPVPYGIILFSVTNIARHKICTSLDL